MSMLSPDSWRGTLLSLLLSYLLPHVALAQFPSPHGANLTRIVSPLNSNITVTFKEPKGACKTAFDSQKQYTGWVNVPGRYDTNLFFWFVAARQPTSLLTIWLNGGPGSSSMVGLFTETGPCEVVELGKDRLGTAAREWGWDRASNMLFIDQPNQVGFSYDVSTNGTLNLLSQEISIPPKSTADYSPLVLNGTFSSQNVSSTANTTELAAKAIYHMMQGFLTTFPQYNPPNSSTLGVNLFAESYGGKYGPIFADVWESENLKRSNGSAFARSTVDIHLTSLGIVNGCVDDLIQGPSYASMMINNTYGARLVQPLQAKLANASFYQPDGCSDLIHQCRDTAAVHDPNNQGDVESVNSICARAQKTCTAQLLDPYGNSGKSYYDIAANVPDSFPRGFYAEYLNTAGVQLAIGAPINYTDTSDEVNTAFAQTGDYERYPTLVPKIARLLRSGVRVGLMYGDRDFICNWIGGEAVSFAIADAAGAPYSSAFNAAGYAPIIVNDSYIGGAVRQFGNLSFSRVYQAGHLVPAYQPETAFQIFARIVMGTSVSTGDRISLDAYNTTGSANATSSFKLPDSPSPTCYVRQLATACAANQVSSLRAGQGTIINGVWYAASSDWPGATSTSTAGSPSTTASTPTLTGLFTATSTPKNGAGTSRLEMKSLILACVIALGLEFARYF
ncbi:uncharacterized protein E0L32_001408 [Thyridium curvatum]|uniref:Carboxypeptidase n=1 Tax=Thyridium curvatum TaxID=1093900 RepID=A0A507AZC7_9PEZI|nr:uncharacterized protein E0L32_001408 [Thyridium curvatum]TPX10211.1 hypothetical protein E0L32_001408 [Thyridium curvatum]